MKKSTLLLIGAVAVASIFLLKKSSAKSGMPTTGSLEPQIGKAPIDVSVVKEDSAQVKLDEIVTAIKTGNTTNTPTMIPSKKKVSTTKSIQQITGITKVTNTMPVTASVTNALRGTISPLTGKLRV